MGNCKIDGFFVESFLCTGTDCREKGGEPEQTALNRHSSSYSPVLGLEVTDIEDFRLSD